MPQLVRLISLLFAVIFSVMVHASQEGILAFDRFQYSSAGIGPSGRVVVSGAQDATRITAFSVQAFGKTTRLSKGDLAKLRGGYINGVQISYETGYEAVGGRTIYVVLSKGFTSGQTETQRITVDEQGKIEIANVVEK